MKPVIYDPMESSIPLDSGMVGLVEQQILLDSAMFIPGMRIDITKLVLLTCD